MSERWKPENGEQYWVVDTCYRKGVRPVSWVNDIIDNTTYKFGNCFKTKEEAQSAAEKIKALLLSLHEPVTEFNQCPKLEVDDRGVVLDLKPLPDTYPKLTAEVFDRPDCPGWVKWAAVAAGGNVICFSNKPYPDDIAGVWHGAKKWAFISSETGGTLKCNASDWRNSLIERHAKLPDWCKVGEWVYLSNAKYHKIKKVDSYGIILDSGIVIKTDDIHAEAVSARIRPYNADEMRGLVGKVVTTSSGRHCTLVTACKQEYSVIEPQVMLNKWLYATDLLNGGNTIDGKPAGVFEHLENGEWVE